MAFHVPTDGRIRNHPTLGSTEADGNNGAFLLGSPEPGWALLLICSDGSDWDNPAERWEHVSVSARRDSGYHTRTPNWREMCHVKRLCWDAEDVVMQLHPRESEYVNNHPDCLHLWRPVNATIPEPPSIFVGVK